MLVLTRGKSRISGEKNPPRVFNLPKFLVELTLKQQSGGEKELGVITVFYLVDWFLSELLRVLSRSVSSQSAASCLLAAGVDIFDKQVVRNSMISLL